MVARLRKTIVNAILCTDMSNHFNMTQDFCKHSPEVGCDGGAGDSGLGTVGLETVGRGAAGMEAVGMGTWVAAELLCDCVTADDWVLAPGPWPVLYPCTPASQ